MTHPAKIVLLPAALVALTALGLLGYRLVPLPVGFADESEAPALKAQLRQLALTWVREGETGREWEGQDTKTVDLGTTMIYAGMAKDRELYEPLQQLAYEHLIVNPRNKNTADFEDSFTHGMVLWRWNNDKNFKADASGTTESLRVAKGLWLGSKAFGIAADRQMALDIIKAYARHQYIDQGMWFIANYYSFGDAKKKDRPGKHKAMNSYLIDYDPDFLAEVAAELGDSPEGLLDNVTDEQHKQGYARTIAELAEHCAALVGKARSPAGLIYDLVQPEVKTLMSGEEAIFSPNDIIQLSTAAAIAEHSARTVPDVARGVLRFGLEHRQNLRCYYLGRTGQLIRNLPLPGYETHGPLLRLAVKLDDRAGRKAFTESTLIYTRAFLANPDSGKLQRMHAVSELLVTMQMLVDRPAR